MRDLPLNSLRALAAVYETGGIRPAGRKLGIAHSAISRHLKELEAGLGVPLFEVRQGHGTLVFTTSGETLGRQALATLQTLETSVASVREDRRGNSLVVDTNTGSESLTNFASALTVDGNVIPSPFTATASGTLDSTEIAGIVRYSNPLMFEGLGSEYPSTGQFLVEGLASSMLLIADNNVDVRIEIDLGADGTVDETIVTTWAELNAQP